MTKSLKAYKTGMLPYIALLSVLVICSSTAREAMGEAIRMCAYTVVPTMIMTMIPSDMICSRLRAREGKLSRLLHRTLGLPAGGLQVLAVGLLCGAPTGIKETAALYKDGAIDEKEALYMSGFVSNAGIPFLLSGVGLGMRGSMIDGVILAVSTVCGALLCGVMTGEKSSEVCSIVRRERKPSDLSEAVEKCSKALPVICVSICFFYSVSGIICAGLPDVPGGVVTGLLEMTGGAKRIAQSALPYPLSMVLSCVILSLGGVSVLTQNLYFMKQVRLSAGRHLRGKLICSIMSGAICFIICTLLG